MNDTLMLEIGSRAMGALMAERADTVTAIKHRMLPFIEKPKPTYDYSKKVVDLDDYVDEVVRVRGELYWCDRVTKKNRLACTKLEGRKAGREHCFNQSEISAIVVLTGSEVKYSA